MSKHFLLSALSFSVLLIGLSFSPAQADEAPIGDAIKNVPLFDAHIHYKKPAWKPYPVESIIELMDKSGVATGLVSSTPDDGTIRLWEYAPNRIVPELRPYHDDAGSSNWTDKDGMADYLRNRLSIHNHDGIGEFHIRSRAMWNEPLMREVIAMAKKRDIPLHIHSGKEPIRWVYGLDADVKIIWAHAGLGEPASAVFELMSQFPGLYADTSLREYAILGSGDDLDPEWKKIVFEFQDRLMVGSDTWVNSQWDSYAEIMSSNRQWLSKLPQEVAEKIAYRNAERLFGRKVSMEQIGTR